MTKIQSFLEQEEREFEKFYNEEGIVIDWSDTEDVLDWLRSHDERLLGKVREEITARYEKWIHAEQFHGFNADRLKKDMEEILSSLDSK